MFEVLLNVLPLADAPERGYQANGIVRLDHHCPLAQAETAGGLDLAWSTALRFCSTDANRARPPQLRILTDEVFPGPSSRQEAGDRLALDQFARLVQVVVDDRVRVDA